MANELAEYIDNYESQLLALEYIFSDGELYSICRKVLEAEYFDVKLRPALVFVAAFVDEYGNLPTPEQITAKSGTTFVNRPVNMSVFESTKDSISEFAAGQALAIAVRDSIPFLDTKDRGVIKENVEKALLVSIDEDVGMELFTNPLEILSELMVGEVLVPTGYDELDEIMGGGMPEKGLIVFSGTSGTGKSVTITNISVNFVERGKNVLYVSLELSEKLVSERAAAMACGAPQTGWRLVANDMAAYLESRKEHFGNFTVKYTPSGTNSIGIESLMRNYERIHGKMPDLLVVDYLDIMGANSGRSGDNVFQKDKEVSEELRNLAGKYGIVCVTASQLNRDAIDTNEHSQSHVAGGISKINTSDFWFSIILDDFMKGEGTIQYKCLKARTSGGVGAYANAKWNNTSLRISNIDQTPFGLVNPLGGKSKEYSFIEGESKTIFDQLVHLKEKELEAEKEEKNKMRNGRKSTKSQMNEIPSSPETTKQEVDVVVDEPIIEDEETQSTESSSMGPRDQLALLAKMKAGVDTSDDGPEIEESQSEPVEEEPAEEEPEIEESQPEPVEESTNDEMDIAEKLALATKESSKINSMNRQNRKSKNDDWKDVVEKDVNKPKNKTINTDTVHSGSGVLDILNSIKM
jgi:KaiC/GvpD/RAD55 family RecA-like ATPase